MSESRKCLNMDTSRPKIIAGCAVGFSTLAMFACMTIVPMLYQQITDLHVDIITQMEEFRVRNYLRLFKTLTHFYAKDLIIFCRLLLMTHGKILL